MVSGCGDFGVQEASLLPDPCPLPDHQKKRSLDQRERLIYAPMSGVGGIVYDKDAVYIDLGGSHSMAQQTEVWTGGAVRPHCGTLLLQLYLLVVYYSVYLETLRVWEGGVCLNYLYTYLYIYNTYTFFVNCIYLYIYNTYSFYL